jgi:hypothetical protein
MWLSRILQECALFSFSDLCRLLSWIFHPTSSLSNTVYTLSAVSVDIVSSLGYTVTVKSSFLDESGSAYFTCTASAKAIKGYTLTWSMAVMGLAALVMGGATYYQRQRRVAKIDLLTEEENAVAGNFEMMGDRGVTV